MTAARDCTVRDERAERAETLEFSDVSSRAIEHLKVHIEDVHWFSTYRVHHRVAEHFRGGRAFLLGDAAHVHSPAGGQGMNTGILLSGFKPEFNLVLKALVVLAVLVVQSPRVSLSNLFRRKG